MQKVDLHACSSPCWPKTHLSHDHQCTLLVMQAHSQNACSTCMTVKQGVSSCLGVDKTSV